MNVAYHLRRLGRKAWPVSAIGADALGEELLRRLDWWNVPSDLIATRSDKRTGLVRVTLRDGSPSYEIVEDAAWDWIELPKEFPVECQPVAAIVFGSLAQREEHNRAQFANLTSRFPDAMRVFDVNLRKPYDSPELIWQLAKQAQLIKLNDEEAIRLLELSDKEADLEQAARKFSERSGCQNICITAGPRGAGLLTEGSWWFWVRGRTIKVKDTIGAGDSFLAGLVDGLLRREKQPPQILEQATRLAEFVASSEGATPSYTVTNTGEIKPD
jgi:fructokinase